MEALWRKLRLLLGLEGPARGLEGGVAEAGQLTEVEVAVEEITTLVQMPAVKSGAGWLLGFETVLPGWQLRVGVPYGAGRSMVIRPNSVTVGDMYGSFNYMAQLREQWDAEPRTEGFEGYIAVDAPGWELTALFARSAERVEYYTRRAGGARLVTGAVRWPELVEALVLSADYEAVVAFLTGRPATPGYYVV